MLLVAAAPRLWAALWDQSVFLPEEIVLSMEPAHHFAFGWGMLHHAFKEGSRSWLFPGLLGLVWKAVAALGVHTSVGLVGVAKLGMAALSLASVWMGMCLARRISGERAAVLSGLLATACPPLIGLSGRCFTESATTPLFVGAALLLEGRSRRSAAIAGAVATVAVFLHAETLLLAGGFLLLLLVRRRTLDARAYLLAATVTLALGGALDWATLGAPFRSLSVHVKQELLDTHGATLGRAAFAYYEDHFVSSMGVTYGIVLLGLALAFRRSPGLVAILVVYVVAHAFVAQRELRYMLAVIPLALPLAATGLTRLFDGLRAGGWPTYALGIGCSLQMAWITHAVTRGQLGYGSSDWVIWHSGEDYFHAVQEAAKTPDLCGIALVANDPPWTGGYTYLHRAVPLFFDTHAEHLGAANVVVGAPNERLPSVWSRGATFGKYALWRRAGACAMPPHDWTMSLPP